MTFLKKKKNGNLFKLKKENSLKKNIGATMVP